MPGDAYLSDIIRLPEDIEEPLELGGYVAWLATIYNG
jgi:hypothetical protein